MEQVLRYFAGVDFSTGLHGTHGSNSAYCRALVRYPQELLECSFLAAEGKPCAYAFHQAAISKRKSRATAEM